MIAAIGEVGFEDYAAVALRGIGFRLPMSFRQYRRVWPARVREKLGIQVYSPRMGRRWDAARRPSGTAGDPAPPAEDPHAMGAPVVARPVRTGK